MAAFQPGLDSFVGYGCSYCGWDIEFYRTAIEYPSG
jgi:hypothetical protein